VTVARQRRWSAVAAAALAAVAVATAGSLATDLGPWYESLAKPAWQPPDWAFGPAWTLIFALWALAAVYAWGGAASISAKAAIVALFSVNGALNAGWSWLFFGVKRPDWAMVEVIFLWLSIAVMVIVLRRYSRIAAWLLVPYLGWVTVAATLNLAVVRLNYPFS